MMDNAGQEDELVVAATFSLPYETQFAKGLLESHGIEVFLGDENIARMASHVTHFGGEKLMVRRSDLPQALELLGSVEVDETQSSGEEADAETCPRCGNPNIQFAGSGGLTAVVSLVIPLALRKKRCRLCGNAWR